MNSTETIYHVEYFFANTWRSSYRCDSLEFAKERKEAEKPFFPKLRIIKETRTVTLEEIE